MPNIEIVEKDGSCCDICNIDENLVVIETYNKRLSNFIFICKTCLQNAVKSFELQSPENAPPPPKAPELRSEKFD